MKTRLWVKSPGAGSADILSFIVGCSRDVPMLQTRQSELKTFCGRSTLLARKLSQSSVFDCPLTSFPCLVRGVLLEMTKKSTCGSFARGEAFRCAILFVAFLG